MYRVGDGEAIMDWNKGVFGNSMTFVLLDIFVQAWPREETFVHPFCYLHRNCTRNEIFREQINGCFIEFMNGTKADIHLPSSYVNVNWAKSKRIFCCYKVIKTPVLKVISMTSELSKVACSIRAGLLFGRLHGPGFIPFPLPPPPGRHEGGLD